MNFKVNTNDVIHIQNPTQTLHQLIIDFNGKQIATSGDITPDSSGQVQLSQTWLEHLDTTAYTIRIQ